MNNTLFEKIVWFFAYLVFMILAITVLSFEEFIPVVDDMVQSKLHISGVSHDVTAVLLNFRSLDTLLEVGVVLLALISIYTVSPHFRYKPLSFPSTMTDTFVSLLFPLIFLSSIYILSSGAYQSGGAFQASALIAGGIIIIRLVKPHYLSNIKESILRFVYSLGLLFFILIGFMTMLDGLFLQYPKEYSYVIIILIETVLTFSLGAVLAAFFITGVHRFKP
ncbi:MnhB domain-containing protein [Arcobacter sp. FWKO B]|uniref:MnhB domain-containing protein n=1 Tax=Arcobacter sp. FWKO B TaxID=2593672 RepID=UPI0018A676C4|nr:MnhB domain-containing protein [Arcobacter sp. FWKO B]QOG13155.1 hypothetical protein FWKOB_10840 [Arcobacter sp. FWKO B]